MRIVYLIMAVLLLLCLAPMPYGYYQLVRFVSMVVFGIMAYQYYEEKKAVLMMVFDHLLYFFNLLLK